MCVLYLPFCYVIWEEVETVTYFIFLGPKSLCMVTAAMESEDDGFLAENRWQS